MEKEENGIVIGNVYNKYSTKNYLAKVLINLFFKVVDGFVNQINPVSIHELGCGEGNLISRYVKPGRDLRASDFSEKIIAEAKSLHGDTGIEFFSSSIYDLSILHKADCIICCEVLEHLENPSLALEVIQNLATQYAIISVPNEPLWRILNMLRGAYIKSFGNTPGHINHWSKNEILALLQSKFEILDVKSPLPWTIALCRSRNCTGKLPGRN